MYNDPPDSNLGPAFDHRMDEEKIWNFPLTVYNTEIVENQWKTNPMQAAFKKSFVPTWSKKLLTDAFFSKEKLNKMKFVWNLRLGLEQIKYRHALLGNTTDEKVYGAMKEEIQEYIDNAYEQLRAREMGDVVVTDHVPKAKKYATTSPSDDEAFFNYSKSVEEYNSDALAPKETSKKELTIEQKVKALPGAERLSDGTLFYKVDDSELVDDETLFNVHQKLIDAQEEVGEEPEEEDDDEDEDDEELNSVYEGLDIEDEYYIELFQKASIDKELLGKDFFDSLNVFQEGEEYSVREDLQSAFKSTQKSLEDQLFDQLPDYYFWDIKKPLTKKQHIEINEFNPMKPIQKRTFFDFRENDEFFRRKERKENINDHRSLKQKL